VTTTFIYFPEFEGFVKNCYLQRNNIFRILSSRFLNRCFKKLAGFEKQEFNISEFKTLIRFENNFNKKEYINQNLKNAQLSKKYSNIVKNVF